MSYINFLFLQSYVNFHQILFGHLYDVCYISLVHDLHIYKVLVAVLIVYHYWRMFFGVYWLVVHIFTWFLIMCHFHINTVSPCNSDRVSSWTGEGNILSCQSYSLFYNTWGFSTFLEWVILLSFYSPGMTSFCCYLLFFFYFFTFLFFLGCQYLPYVYLHWLFLCYFGVVMLYLSIFSPSYYFLSSFSALFT